MNIVVVCSSTCLPLHSLTPHCVSLCCSDPFIIFWACEWNALPLHIPVGWPLTMPAMVKYTHTHTYASKKHTYTNKSLYSTDRKRDVALSWCVFDPSVLPRSWLIASEGRFLPQRLCCRGCFFSFRGEKPKALLNHLSLSHRPSSLLPCYPPPTRHVQLSWALSCILLAPARQKPLANSRPR